MSAGRRLGGWRGWCSPCAEERPLELTELGPRGAGAWLAGAAAATRELRLTCSACGGWQHVPRNETDDVDGGLPALSPSLAAASGPVAPAVAPYEAAHAEARVEPSPVPAADALRPVAADYVARAQHRGEAGRGRRSWLQVAPAAVAMVFVSLLVMRTSTAAFSGTTTNGTNNWTAGTVRLSDDDVNGAMFTASGLRPGETGSRCIKVTYEGSVAATAGVRLYNTNYAETDAGGDGALLDDHLNLLVEWDTTTTGTFAGGCGDFAAEGTSFNGSLKTMTTQHSDWTNGARAVPPTGDWTPPAAPPNTSRVFKFTWTLASGAPDTVQGDSSSVRFTWEARTT